MEHISSTGWLDLIPCMWFIFGPSCGFDIYSETPFCAFDLPRHRGLDNYFYKV